MDFRLQFDEREIRILAQRYNDPREGRALSAGRLIVGGDYSRSNLDAIYDWKTRNMHGMVRLLNGNTDVEIADILRLAISAQTDRGAIAAVMGLEGINVAAASAVLTAMYPERYTVIDFRALASLGVKKKWLTVSFYLAYLADCRERAHKNEVTLRDLDRALWQWSKDKKQSRN